MPSPKPIYLCIHVAEFPAQTTLRLRPELRGHPFAILDGDRPFERAVSRSPQAATLGLAPGSTRAEAESFAIPLLRRSPAEEAATRDALLSTLSPFTPSFEDHSTGVDCILVLDLAGTERLHGPLPRATERLRAAIRELGLSARLVSSTNLHTALCLARTRFGHTLHVTSGEEAQTLAPVPLATLQLDPTHADTLRNWGIRTLGELAQLPETELITALGPLGHHLRELARGTLPHLFQPIPIPFTLTEFREFDFPVDLLDPLLFVLNAQLEQLSRRAASRALALASLTIECGLEPTAAAPAPAPHTRTVRPALPTEDRALLLKLLHLELQAHPPEQPVVSLRLAAQAAPASKVQLGLFAPQLPETMRLEITLARLRAIVGDDRVGQAVLADSHQSGSLHLQPFTIPPTRSTARPSALPTHSAPALRRLRPAAPVRIALSSAPPQPTSFWHNNQHFTVHHLFGPWRSSGGWWAEHLWSAELWDVSALAPDGALLLGILAHDHRSHQWLLEAIYD